MKKIFKRSICALGMVSLMMSASNVSANEQTAKQDIDFECFAGVFAECSGMGSDQNQTKMSTQDFTEIMNCVMENISQCM